MFEVTKKVAGDVFTIIHTKVIKDINNVDFTVLDKVESVTLNQLQDKKQVLLEQISNLDKQVADLNVQILAAKAYK